MDAQELKHMSRGNQQRVVESVQMSTNGPYMSARYVNALSRLNGSYHRGMYQQVSTTQSATAPQMDGQMVTPPCTEVREVVASAQMQMSSEQANIRKHDHGQPYVQPGSKRWKDGGLNEGGNHSYLQLLPSHADPCQSNNAQLSMQHTSSQHAHQLLIHRSSSDASNKSLDGPINRSPSRFPTEDSSVTNSRTPMEGTHPSHSTLSSEASYASHRKSPLENMHCEPSRSSFEAINANPSSAHHSSSRLSFEGSPRIFVHNSPCPPNVSSHPPATIQEPMQVPDTSSRRLSVKEWGNKPLSSIDPLLFSIMEREKARQWKGIELIASENFTSQAVMDVLGSHLVNKYSEGLPGARYYGGNEYIDQIESLCRERALLAFCLDPESWGVNVQPYSCTSANFAVYTALLQPKDRIMGLDSPSGGHLSHGYYTSGGKKVSAASIFFENLPYKVNPETGYIDYDKLEEKALDYRPKILICGGSSYPREWDYARFRKIADKVGAILMCDMAHISGLVAAQECASPFDFCDIVTSTTHKSLRGPRGGLIFYRKGLRRQSNASEAQCTEQFDYEDRVNFAVFPSLQGGPHDNQVGALAVALKQVAVPEFKTYIQQVKKNAQALVVALQRRGGKLVTDGTDNHLLLWDLRPYGLTGFRYEKVCELCHITLNKNALYGDSGTYAPGGVRIGTLAMTSRGCVESDFETIAEFLFRALQIALSVQRREQGKATNKDFLRSLHASKDAEDLRHSVEKFASSLELPGLDTHRC